MDRIERIRDMEQRMDRVARWVGTVSAALEEQSSVGEDVYELTAYYESSRWMEDYEADEAGELPEDLKRGVLSEDGLYDLLSAYEELLLRLRDMGKSP